MGLITQKRLHCLHNISNKSDGYVSHCGGNDWGELMEKWGVVDYRYLASTTGSSISI